MPGPIDFSNFAKNAPELSNEDLDLRRSSACSSMSHLICDSEVSTGASLASGSVYGVLAYNKVAQPYTKIRFCTAATAPSTLTSLVLGVTDVNGVVLASTADVSGSVTAASTLMDNLALSAPVTLAQGQPVYLAVGYAGTTLTVLGLVLRNAQLTSMAQLAWPLTRSKTGYSTGPIPALTTSGATSFLPWIELIP